MISKISNNFNQNNRYIVAFKSNPQKATSLRNEDNKDKSKNNLPSVLLGALVLGLGTFVLAKGKKIKKGNADIFSKELEEAQIQLKNIFGRDFSKKETEEITKRYIEINKITDDKEFCKTLFKQLKEDFKVENKNLDLELMKNELAVGNGVFYGYTEALTRFISATPTIGRKNIIKTLFHEFRHVKQNELMYRTDPSKLIEIKVRELEKSNNASYQEIINKFGGNKIKARQYIKNEVEKIYQENWGHLKKLPKNSNDYAKGIKYLDNEANRIPTGEHYYEQILEKEAQFVENCADRLFGIISKIV